MNSAQRIIAKFGGQTSLARLLGRGQSTVQHWANRGAIPKNWHQKILDLAVERRSLAVQDVDHVLCLGADGDRIHEIVGEVVGGDRFELGHLVEQPLDLRRRVRAKL